MLFDTISQDNLKLLWQKEKLLSIKYTYIYRYCQYIFLQAFCIFVACGKGLMLFRIRTLSNVSSAEEFGIQIVTKLEISQNKQFLTLPQCFQLYSIILLTFTDIFYIFVQRFFKVVSCRFVVCGKGLREIFRGISVYSFISWLQNTLIFIFRIN